MSKDHMTLLSRFKKYLIKQDLSERTIKGYLDDLYFFSAWYEEIQNKKISWSKVTSFDLQSFRQHLVKAKSQKFSAVNRRIQALKRFFDWAHRHHFINSENPVEHLRFMRKQSPSQPQALTKTEVHRLLCTAKQSSDRLSKRNYAILQLMLQTGLRIGEVIQLRFSDICLKSHSGILKVADGKGRKSREIPLNLTVRHALKSYFKEFENEDPNSPVFQSTHQDALSLRSIQVIIQGLVKRAKLNRISVSAHTLRHTFAANFLQVNPHQSKELAQLLGRVGANYASN